MTSQVVGFKKIKFHTNENVGSGELQMPENEMHTTAYWLTVPARADGAPALRAARSGATGWWRSPTRWARWPRSS